jgi:hypothetical protein
MISVRSLITSISIRYPLIAPKHTVRCTNSIVKQTTYLTSLRKARGFLQKNLFHRGAISSKVQMQLGKLRANSHVINLTTETVTETSVYFNHLTLLSVRQEYTVGPRKSNGLILEQLETRTKNSRKIRFETQIKIRKSNHERGIAQHRAAHAHLTRKSNKLKVEPPLGTDCVRVSRVHCTKTEGNEQTKKDEWIHKKSDF